MKLCKLLILIPALMLPLTLAGCDNGGGETEVGEPAGETGTEGAEATEETVGEGAGAVGEGAEATGETE